MSLALHRLSKSKLSTMLSTFINGFLILITLINSTIAYDLIGVNNNVFQIFNASTNEHYMGNCLYNKGNYTNTSQFKTNLSKVFTNLISLSSSTTFSNSTSGSGQEAAHAWFYCSDPDDHHLCSSCVQNSTKAIEYICSTKTAIIYSTFDCQVWYTNTSIFPEDDTTSFNYATSTMPNMPDPVALNRTIVGSMLKLIDLVVANSSSDSEKEYVSGLYLGQEVFTYVKCLGGVSKIKCKDCLVKALNETMMNCLSSGSAWAVDFRSTCQMRYSSLLSTNSSLPLTSSPHSSILGSSPTNMASTIAEFCTWRWLLSPWWIIVATILV